MFKEPGQGAEHARDDAASPATLVHAQIVESGAPLSPPRGAPPALLERLRGWRAAAENWLGSLDLAPDLSLEIGSRRWFRGLGTMLAMSAAAIAMWPDFSQVEAAALPADAEVRDEFRSNMIMPLALGSESGRRMGATTQVRPLNGAPERPSLQLTATLGQGDSLDRMLQRAGLGAADVSQVDALVSGSLPPGQIANGTRFDITLGRRPQPGTPRTLESLAFRARFDLDLTVTRQDGRLALLRRPIRVDTTPLRIRGAIGSSLYRSARNAGAPVAAIQAYLRAIDPHLSLESDIDPADEFDIVVAYKRSARGEREMGELLYAGLEHAGKPRLQLLRWGADGNLVDISGAGRSNERAVGAPVAGYVTSSFGMRRHPILGYSRMHSGVDFGARYGSPIYAVADATVAFAGRHGGHGNYVRLNHGGGNGTGYAHMSRIAVIPGMRVRAGQVIGYVGSTGLSTGPHLHFEAYLGNRKINPLGMRFASRPQFDERELSEFKRRLDSLRAVVPGAALQGLARASALASTPLPTHAIAMAGQPRERD